MPGYRVSADSPSPYSATNTPAAAESCQVSNTELSLDRISSVFILFRNRLISLPRKRRLHKMGNTVAELTNAELKLKEKIEDVYKFEPPQQESIDLKTFCKLLKKSSL